MPPRALIFTASTPAGHDSAAEVLAAGLRERGATAAIVDGVEAGGSAARAILRGTAALERAAGGRVFDAGYRLATGVGPVRRAGSRVLDQVLGERVQAYLRAHEADVAVSTHPLTTELLGRLRASGRLATPVVSAIADLAALHFKAHPGVDLHLVAHPESEAEVRSIAGPSTRIEAADGLTDPRLRDPPERNAARAELELPTRGSLVVVSGGARGAGDLATAIETAIHYSADTIVVLTGANAAARDRLRARFGEHERVRVQGFPDDMVALLAAADVLIHSTAGPVVLDARMCDCRVISYGWPYGPVRVSERAYERLDFVSVARSRTELAHALVAALSAPPAHVAIPELPAAADLVLELCSREPARAG